MMQSGITPNSSYVVNLMCALVIFVQPGMNAVQLVMRLSQLFADSAEFTWQCVWLVDGTIVNVECKNIHPLYEKDPLAIYCKRLRTNHRD